MTDKELIPIDSFRINITGSAVVANFGEMDDMITKTIDEHRFVVTEETVKDAKSVTATFRKSAKLLTSLWKEKRELAIKDVLVADTAVKNLSQRMLDFAGDMAEQTATFEDTTKKLCADLLREELSLQWDALDVKPDYRKAGFMDLALLGSISKGKLTKPIKKEIEVRATLDKAYQDKIDARLKNLELLCLQHGIVPPLSEYSIAAFLHDHDEKYNQCLEKLIEAEVTRMEEAERRLREKLEAEKQKAIDDALKAQQAEAIRVAKEMAPEPVAEELKPEPVVEKATPDDAVPFVLKATIEKVFMAKPNANKGAMEAYFITLLKRDYEIKSMTIEKQ